MTRTQSIPIRSKAITDRDEEDQHRGAIVADYQDYLFYSRIVGGMKERQDKSRSIDLRYQNQALIDHITNTRNSTLEAPILHPFSSYEQVAHCVSQTRTLINEEVDMMFDMDM
jgi:hypothetical protein